MTFNKQWTNSWERRKLAQTLRVIAFHRSNNSNLRYLAVSIELGNVGSSLSIGVAYNRLPGSGQHSSDQTIRSCYQRLSAGASLRSKDRLTEALQAVAGDRKSNFLLENLERYAQERFADSNEDRTEHVRTPRQGWASPW